MTSAMTLRTRRSLGGLLTVLAFLAQTGCVSFAMKAVPAGRLPHAYKAETKCQQVPVNFALLRQEAPPEHIFGAGDLLSVYVPGVLPPKNDEVPLNASVASMVRDYYPPNGMIDAPVMGLPVRVGADGSINLPLLKNPINVSGKTIATINEEVLAAYKATGILPEGREKVNVELLRARTHRVVVLRDDVGVDIPQQINKGNVVYTKRGRGEVIDLPAFENDVLHVIAATGGLPGIDAYNHIWILKSNKHQGAAQDAITRVEAGENPEAVFQQMDVNRTAIRIPLKINPGEQPPFSASDVVLHDGDIVYIEPRNSEVFYTGGLLNGGQVPLPRDHDIDVLEAVAIANGSVGGPGGAGGAAVFRTGAGPGNIVPPTRVIILRKLENGQQLQIRVDLARAKHDPKERIVIQPGDFLMLQYKPGEMASNVALNFFNFNFTYLYSGN